MRAKYLFLASAAALGAFAASAAWAQTAQSPEQSTASSDAITEIVVRAQRIEQSEQKVPVAVTAVSAADLSVRGLHDLATLTLAVPSLDLNTDNTYNLRGVGSSIFSDNVDSSVGVMVDDVSIGVPIFMSGGEFLDVQQVEALPGPQGLLFGRNSSAGLLNIITNRPKLNEFGGSGSLEYDDRDKAPGGHFGLVATGVINLPLTQTSALRLNVLESDQDPIVDYRINLSPNAQLNQKRLEFKAKYLLKPTDRLNVYVIADYSRERGAGGIWDSTWRSAAAGSTIATFTGLEGVTPSPTNLTGGLYGPMYRSVDTGGVSVNMSYELSDALTLSDIAAWRAYDLSFNFESDTTAINGLPINEHTGHYNQFSNELRLAVKYSRIDGQIGLYAFHSNDYGNGMFQGANGTELPGAPVAIPNFIYGTNHYTLHNTSLAAYGQFNFHVTDQLTLVAGVRETGDQINVHAMADNYTQTPIAFPFGPGGPPSLLFPLVNIFGPPGQNYGESRSASNFSYKIGPQFEIAKDIMVYATYGTGYKGPAFSTSLAYVKQDPYIKPETVSDLEVGIKSFLFDRKLRINADVFYENFTNWQSQSFTPQAVAILGNAEGVRSQGVELNVTAKPLSALTINYNATVLDAYFTNYSTDPCYLAQSAATCPNGAFFQGKDVAMPSSAHYHGTLEALYTIPINDNRRVVLEANWFHRSSINFLGNAAPFTELGAFSMFGANVSYKTDNGLNVSVFCKDCANKLVPTFVGDYPPDAGTHHLSVYQRWGYNSVRTIGVLVSKEF